MGSGKGKARRARGALLGEPGGNPPPDLPPVETLLTQSDQWKQIVIPDDLISCEVELEGLDGNAGSLMGEISRGLKRAGNPVEIIDRFRRDAMSGNYEHLLAVCQAYSDGDARTDSEVAAEQQAVKDEISERQTF